MIKPCTRKWQRTERHSCETTLLGLIEDWKRAVDSKQLVYVLSTDMSKVFDCLSHSLTIKKLEAYGFGSGSLDLMGLLFENRWNRVKLSEITSDWKLMKRGLVGKDHPSRPYCGTCSRMILIPSHVENGDILICMRTTINCMWREQITKLLDSNWKHPENKKQASSDVVVKNPFISQPSEVLIPKYY